jgi:hypothetical protein
MPAQHAVSHHQTSAFVDDCLLDDEFDGFEVAPAYNRKPGIGHNLVLCEGMEFDEAEDELELL